jgi:hypothetical protein
VRNPVEPDENFADKWNENRKLGEVFVEWMKKAKDDFTNALAGKTATEAAFILSPILGRSTMLAAAQAIGTPGLETANVPMRIEPQVPPLASAAHVQPLRWPQQIIGKVSVRGGVFLGSRKGKKLWDLSPRPLLHPHLQRESAPFSVAALGHSDCVGYMETQHHPCTGCTPKLVSTVDRASPWCWITAHYHASRLIYFKFMQVSTSATLNRILGVTICRRWYSPALVIL